MKRISITALLMVFAIPPLMVAATSGAPAQDTESSSRPAHMSRDEATRQELITILNNMAQASIRGDADFFDRVLSEDYIVTTITGQVKGKAEVLKDYRSGDIKFKSHVFDDFVVHLYGNTAVVTNRAKAVEIFRGQERTGLSRNTRVFVKRKGHWECVAFQSTRVPKEE